MLYIQNLQAKSTIGEQQWVNVEDIGMCMVQYLFVGRHSHHEQLWLNTKEAMQLGEKFIIDFLLSPKWLFLQLDFGVETFWNQTFGYQGMVIFLMTFEQISEKLILII